MKNKFFINFFLILVFLLISIFMSSVWFRNSYVYTPEELYFTNYQVTLHKSIESWDYSINGGGPTLPKYHSSIVPNGLFYYVLSALGLPNFIIQRVFMGIVIFLTLVSISYFLRLFTNNPLIILVSALMYYLNFYVKSTPFYSAKMFQLILMPLFFTWTYKYIKTLDYRYAIYNFLALFFTQVIFVNLANTAVIFLTYPLAIIYSRINLSISTCYFLKKYALKIVFFFLPIITILIYHASIYYFYFNSNFVDVLRASDKFTALTAPINLVLQLRGAWWEKLGFSGASYNPWFWFYDNIRIQQISYFFVAFSLIFTLRKKINRSGLYFLIFFLISLIFSTGSSFYPNLYKWFFDNIPYFYIFREPWPKFIPLTLFSLTALLTISLEEFKSKFLRKLLPLMILYLVLVRGFPFFSTDFLPYYQPRWYNPHLKLPDYWNDWINWSKKNQDKNVFLIPTNYFKRDWYKEDLGNADYPIAQVFGFSNTIYNAVLYNQIGAVANYFTSQNNNNYVKIMPVDYFLVQNDIEKNPRYYNQSIEDSTNDILKRFADKPLLKFKNKLTLFFIKPQYKLPLIFTSNSYRIVENLQNLAKTISDDNYVAKNSIIYLKNDLKNINNLKTFKFINDKNLEIKFKKISNTNLEVNIDSASKPFVLVFNTLYNQNWKLEEIDTKTIIDKKYHLQVNGYANSWIIDPQQICRSDKCFKNKDRSNNLNFRLSYWPQFIFNIGAFINFAILTGFIFYLALFSKKRHS